jgi:hypothetical protein
MLFRLWFAVAFTILLLGCTRKPANEFERKHEESLSRNPTALVLTLTTADNRTAYHRFELIPVRLIFTTSKPGEYKVELAKGMNVAAVNDKFMVSPAQTVFWVSPVNGNRGIVCCDTRRPYLGSSPITASDELTFHIRFTQPGAYEVYVISHRVFLASDKPTSGREKYHEPSKMPVTSSLLHLTILADDPQWEASELSRLLQTRNSPTATPEQIADAARAMWVFDTEAGIRARFAETTPQGAVPNFTYTIRPDLAVRGLENLAQRPDWPVDLNQASEITSLEVRRDHPELLMGLGDDPEGGKQQSMLYEKYREEAQSRLIAELRKTLPHKLPKARKVTLETIHSLEQMPNH